MCECFPPSNAATPQRRNAATPVPLESLWSPFGVPLESLWKAEIILLEQSSV